jgi:hypothetical protein
MDITMTKTSIKRGTARSYKLILLFASSMTMMFADFSAFVVSKSRWIG